MEVESIKKRLFEAIGNNIDTAFSIIEELLSPESSHYPTILVRRGQWTSVKEDINMGILTKYSEECKQVTNEIRSALVDIIIKIAEKDLLSARNDVDNNEQKRVDDIIKPKSMPINKALYYVLRRSEEKYINPFNTPYGYVELDKLTYGIKSDNLNLISASSEEHNRLFALNIALKMSEMFRRRILYISFHLQALDIAERLLSIKSKIKSWNISNGKLKDWEWAGVQESVECLTSLPISITDHLKTIEDIKDHVIDILKDDYVELIIIDNLEYIDFNTNLSNDEKVKKIKSINKEFQIPILLLSKLNKKTGTFFSNKPQIQDIGLDESNNTIYLDNIFLMYHPESIGILEGENGIDLRNIIEIIIAKNSSGNVGNIRLRFDISTGLISEQEQTEEFYSNMFKISRMNDEDIPF